MGEFFSVGVHGGGCLLVLVALTALMIFGGTVWLVLALLG
jgi:hypothetical protein